MNYPFDNKIALVTGGNSGIGAATVLAFAQSGATVIIAARRHQQAQNIIDLANDSSKSNIDFIETNIAEPADIDNLFATIMAKYGRLDFAVNNAGMVGPINMSITEYSLEDYEQVMRVNTTSVYLCMQHQLKIMYQQQTGAIVNIASTAGLRAGRFSGFAYTTSKHAVNGMTKSAAKEAAEKNIRVNAICPGLIETPMLEVIDFCNQQPAELGVEDEHVGQPEQIAAAILWLCSDQASFVNGVNLPIDGGLLA